MKKRLRDRWAWLFAAAWLLLGQAVAAETNTLVIPPEFADQPGDTSEGIVYYESSYQEVYSGSLFTAAVTDIILITGIAFRLDELDPDSGSLEVVIPKVEIHASTHLGTIPQLSRFENENWGPDRTRVVYAENFHMNARRQAGNLSDFQVKFVFDVPFAYDRRAGNLLFDFRLPQRPQGNAARTDFSQTLERSSSAVLYGGGELIFGVGDILQISYIPVPESSFLNFLLIGGVILISFTNKLSR